MASPRQESELQDTVVRIIPKFTSFRPPPTSLENETNGSGGGCEPDQGFQHFVPKFSSFKPPVQVLEPSVPSNAASGSDRAGHRHRDRQRSSSWHRYRSRERDRHRTHRHRSKERRRDYDEDYHREGSQERTSLWDKRRRSKSRERERERHRDRESSRSYRTREADEGESRKRKEAVSGSTGAILPWDDENMSGAQLFYINTKGDPANLIYGTIHRYSIPQYYRYGKGGIVGLSPDIRIIQDKGDGKGLVLATSVERAEHHKRGLNGERKYRFALPDASGLRRLKVVTEEDLAEGEKVGTEFERGLEYVPLSSRRHKSGGRNGDEENMHERLFFSLSGDRDQQLEDEDFEYASGSDDEVDEMSAWNSTQVRHKQLDIQRRIDSNPSDISAWLELVAHQDKILYCGNGRKKKATVAERKSTAEIKLSILSKAMEKMLQDDRTGKEKLWECWFQVAGETWEPEKLLSKYRSTLRQYPTMHRVWVQYLNFRQTDFDSFKYTDMVGCYEQCLEVLRTAIYNKEKDDQDIPLLEEIAVYVILRGIHLMREAGYIEISIASLQALLELNIFAPENVLNHYPLSSHASYDSIMEQLRNFWDSEVLRAGEEGAEGWYRYVEKGNEGPVPEGIRRERAEEEEDTYIDKDDPFGWWIQKEIDTTEKRGAWPARVVDEAEEADPYNVVLSTDIVRWMFCLSNETVRKSLINHMLEFCGLPGCFVSLEWKPEGETDSHLDTFLCGYEMGFGRWFWPQWGENPKPITWEGMEPERQPDIMNDPFGFKLNGGYPITVDMLFGRQNGEWAYPLIEVPNSGDRLTADIHMARRVLKMVIYGSVVDPRSSERLALLYWALELRIDPVKAQKLGKKLLKKYRTSLLLYNAYAQIEWRMGNIDVARKVFSTALSMCDSYPEDSRRDGILLWKTWAWEEIMEGNRREALEILLSIPDAKFSGNKEGYDSTLNKAVRLRTKRFLQEQQNRLASLGLVEYAFAYNEAMALMEYLSSSSESRSTILDVSSSIPIYDALLKELRERGLSSSRQYEIGLMNGKVRLLYYHSRTSRSFRMASLREALEEAIVEVKQLGRKVNTLLWSLYAWNEGRSRIEGRIRGWLKDQVVGPGDKGSTVAGYAFAIWAESRMVGRNVHAVRKLFEEAVECPFTRGSVPLWRLYIEFEIREREPTKAKLVFFRALRCCPWSRDIAMLAFTKLMSVLNFDELKKVLAIMTAEKELRVYDTTTVEDFLEEMGDGRGRDLYPGISVLRGIKKQNAVELHESHNEGEMNED